MFMLNSRGGVFIGWDCVEVDFFIWPYFLSDFFLLVHYTFLVVHYLFRLRMRLYLVLIDPFRPRVRLYSVQPVTPWPRKFRHIMISMTLGSQMKNNMSWLNIRYLIPSVDICRFHVTRCIVSVYINHWW